MSITLTYNGYSNLKDVRFDGYNHEPVYAPDGISHETTKHTISGTALINSNVSDAAFQADLESARQRLTRPMGKLAIAINGVTLIDTTGDSSGIDEMNGPKAIFKITEILGSRTALVSFQIDWWEYEKLSSETKTDVLSHRWIQTWKYDEMGLATRTVAGTLRVRANADAPAGTAPAVGDPTGGNNPDYYRLVVVPDLPEGFRRVRQEFATDESGNQLIYTIEDREYPRGFPSHAKAGDANFVYRRSLDSSGILGRKTFTCELAGDKSTSAAKLLASAVNVSKNRINYAVTFGDIITDIRVEELNMFTENRIRFEVNAMGKGNANNPFDPPGTKMLTDIFKDLNLEPYSPPGPWGSALVASARRELWTVVGDNGELPRAEHEQLTIGTIENSYVLPQAQFEAAQAGLIPVGPAKPSDADNADTSNPYLDATIIERLEIDSGMGVVQSQSLAGADVPFQFRKPKVYLISEATIERAGIPPNRNMVGYPAGSVLEYDRFNVKQTRVDAQNKPVFTGRYERRLRLYDRNNEGDTAWKTLGDTGGTIGPITPGPGIFAVRFFWPPISGLLAPPDPKLKPLLTNVQSLPSTIDVAGTEWMPLYAIGPGDPPFKA